MYLLIYFSVVASTVVEKPNKSEVENTFETNTGHEEKAVEQPNDTFENFFKDFEVEENENNKCSPTTIESSVQYTVQPVVQSQNSKQSLFIRLANRIKVFRFYFLKCYVLLLFMIIDDYRIFHRI